MNIFKLGFKALFYFFELSQTQEVMKNPTNHGKKDN